MIEIKESKTRDIPVWLTVLVILLCVGGGAWMIRWYVKDKPKDTIVIKDDKPGRGNFTRAFSGNGGGNATGSDRGDRTARWTPGGGNQGGDGVAKNGRDSHVVRAGTAQMYVYQDRKGAITLNPSYGNMSLYSPDEREFVAFVQHIRSDRTWRDTLGITDDQQKKLRDIPPAPGMKWEKADEAKLTELWKAYEKTTGDKSAAEKSLVSTLDDVAKRSLEPTKKYHQERMALIKTIITDQQFKAYKEAGSKPARLVDPAAAKPDPATPKPDPKPGTVNSVVTAIPTPPTTAPAATKPAPANIVAPK